MLICINNNNSAINNNYGRLQNLILLFKIPMCSGKNFFEIYLNLGTRLQNDSPSMSYEHGFFRVCRGSVPNIVPIFEISNIEEMIKQKRLRRVWV
jgi:hypothetical protein